MNTKLCRCEKWVALCCFLVIGACSNKTASNSNSAPPTKPQLPSVGKLGAADNPSPSLVPTAAKDHSGKSDIEKQIEEMAEDGSTADMLFEQYQKKKYWPMKNTRGNEYLLLA